MRGWLTVSRFGPLLIVLLGLGIIWYLAALWLNIPAQYGIYQRADVTEWSTPQLIGDAWSQQKPKLPAPHQIIAEMWQETTGYALNDKKSLIFHGWITLSATLYGFVSGTLLGIGLAIAIVLNRATNRSLMPWIIASQAVPILAIAPMIVVIGYNVMAGALDLPTDAARLVSKAVISAYLAFFPVTVGMVKGLRSPEIIQLDLMRTYNASAAQTFWKLRWPSAMPFLFTSMKVAIAAAVIGTVVGELPTGATGGIGARLLSGSQFGQTLQIWAALFAASALSALLVIIVGVAERLVFARMGVKP
ncbi:MAG: transporter permease [Devosia sp.]|nr:transporter permease [Devosia sp.]